MLKHHSFNLIGKKSEKIRQQHRRHFQKKHIFVIYISFFYIMNKLSDFFSLLREREKKSKEYNLIVEPIYTIHLFSDLDLLFIL